MWMGGDACVARSLPTLMSCAVGDACVARSLPTRTKRATNHDRGDASVPTSLPPNPRPYSTGPKLCFRFIIVFLEYLFSRLYTSAIITFIKPYMELRHLKYERAAGTATGTGIEMVQATTHHPVRMRPARTGRRRHLLATQY